MKRFHVVRHTLPYVAWHTSVRAGTGLEPPGKAGLARIVASMLTRGGKTLDREGLAEELDFLGTSINVSAGNESAHISGDCSTRNLGRHMELVADSVLAPSFAEEELHKLVRRTIAEMAELRDNDSALVSRFIRQLLFRGHSYGNPARGFESSVREITVEDVRQFYLANYNSAHLCVGSAGDLSEEDAGGSLVKTFSALPGGPNGAATTVPAPYTGGHRVLLVTKPERTQSTVAMGQLAIPGSDDRLMPFGVAATGFGGTFTSVLVREIREKRGWSYGVGAGLIPGAVTGVFQGRWAPQTADTAESVALVLELLGDFATNGLPDGELEFARQYLVNQFPFMVDTPVRRLEVEMNAYLIGKPADYLERYVARVKAVTPALAGEAVSTVLRPDSMGIVVVGDESLAEPLSQLPGVAWFRQIPHTWDEPLPE